MKSIRVIPFAVLAFAFLATGLAESAVGTEESPAVVASVKPVHSLLAAVMEGTGAPDLLVEGAGSPHHYALKPSQAALLEEADLVFWIGPALETSLEKPLHTIASGARIIRLGTLDGLTLYRFRENAAFTDEHEEEHGHDDGHDHEDDHGEDAINPHIWLDPENAKTIVRAMATALIETDPAHADIYRNNTRKVLKRLENLLLETRTTLAPIQGKRYLVFHDAYHYFEARFDVPAAGAITVSPEKAPGAEKLRALKDRIRDADILCVFAEPQFEPKVIDIVTEGTNVRIGTLDPLGAELEPGPTLYANLIRAMAQSLSDCLTE